MSLMGSENKFKYDGRLVFNEIRTAEVNVDEDELKEDLLDEFPSFSEGTPGSPGSGYEGLELSEHTNRYGDLDEKLQEIAENITDIGYKKEDYSSAEDVVDADGNEVDGFDKSTTKVYVYWDYPNYVFFQGSDGKTDHVAPETNSALGEKATLNEETFDPGFLLWLFEKYDKGDTLPSDLTIEQLKDAELSGDLSSFGKTNEVNDSEDISESIPVQAGLLQGMNIKKLRGRFNVKGYRIKAEIKPDRVQIIVSYAINEATQLERVLIALLFLTELAELHDHWKGLDKQNQYPHPEYFVEMRKDAAQGQDSANFDFEYETLVRKYANLREEDISKHSDLSFELDEE
jgi:hypothetical protein